MIELNSPALIQMFKEKNNYEQKGLRRRSHPYIWIQSGVVFSPNLKFGDSDNGSG